MAPSRPAAIAVVAFGGALGSIARYGVGLFVPGLDGTFLVNVTGSFALGYVFYTSATTDRIPSRLRLFVATGFLSSYTTYSLFALQTVDVSLIWGLLNVVGSYACGFGAAILGRRLVVGDGR